jgi:hypothetical protein
MHPTFLFSVTAIMIGWGASVRANPTELDGWCAQAKLPSSIALCSDPELRQLAIDRNRAFDAAHARLSADAYRALLRDHKGWIRAHSTACGIGETTAPVLPLAPDTLSCLKPFPSTITEKKELEGKKFNPNKEHEADGEYGKFIFAERAVKPNADAIDFSGFKPMVI